MAQLLLARAGALPAKVITPGPEKGGGGEMLLYVRDPGGEVHCVEVSADATGKHVLDDLCSRGAAGVGDSLSFGGTELQPTDQLADAGVSAQATLSLSKALPWKWSPATCFRSTGKYLFSVDATGRVCQKTLEPEYITSICSEQDALSDGTGTPVCRMRVDGLAGNLNDMDFGLVAPAAFAPEPTGGWVRHSSRGLVVSFVGDWHHGDDVVVNGLSYQFPARVLNHCTSMFVTCEIKGGDGRCLCTIKCTDADDADKVYADIVHGEDQDPDWASSLAGWRWGCAVRRTGVSVTFY
eukprot:TRINITY_DN6052_c0_g1_i2.p1 TRINITY_DN6052_c0_g1~~TRINITY_DN6052_c0_g1_i2.p1  ORF type:complete len:295 (+),score=49.60 TRINITY_DN6052_c0_g1_i2:81-965(+)